MMEYIHKCEGWTNAELQGNVHVFISRDEDETGERPKDGAVYQECEEGKQGIKNAATLGS